MDDERNNLLKSIHYLSIEKYILIIAVLMIILLVGLNILRIYTDYTMTHFSETRAFYDPSNILYNTGTITLSIDEAYPMLEIMINGNLIDKFDGDKEIILNVTDRDIVQINGSMYKDDIIVTINNISSNISNHLNSTQITVQQSISTLAIIKM